MTSSHFSFRCLSHTHTRAHTCVFTLSVCLIDPPDNLLTEQRVPGSTSEIYKMIYVYSSGQNASDPDAKKKFRYNKNTRGTSRDTAEGPEVKGRQAQQQDDDDGGRETEECECTFTLVCSSVRCPRVTSCVRQRSEGVAGLTGCWRTKLRDGRKKKEIINTRNERTSSDNDTTLEENSDSLHG